MHSDINALNNFIPEKDIQLVSKWSWKKYLTEFFLRNVAWVQLTQENSSMEKTKNITFKNLNMSKYIQDNKNKGLSKKFQYQIPDPRYQRVKTMEIIK